MIIEKEEFFPTVCKIFIPNGNSLNLGTGILIGYEKKRYLVTSTKVIKNFNKDAYIYLNSKKILISEFKVPDKNWISHPFADVSILEIKKENYLYISEILLYPYFYFSEDLVPKRPFIKRPLMTIGHSSEKITNEEPFCFEALPISNNLVEHFIVDTNKKCDFICMGEPIMNGYSGSLVLDLDCIKTKLGTILGDKIRVIGINHGTGFDSNGKKIVLITPVKYLLDIFEMDNKS